MFKDEKLSAFNALPKEKITGGLVGTDGALKRVADKLLELDDDGYNAAMIAQMFNEHCAENEKDKVSMRKMAAFLSSERKRRVAEEAQRPVKKQGRPKKILQPTKATKAAKDNDKNADREDAETAGAEKSGAQANEEVRNFSKDEIVEGRMNEQGMVLKENVLPPKVGEVYCTEYTGDQRFRAQKIEPHEYGGVAGVGKKRGNAVYHEKV